MHVRPRLVIAAISASLALGACGTNTTPIADPDTSPTVRPSDSPAPAPSATTDEPPFTANTEPDTGEAAGFPSTLIDMEVEDFDGYTRLTMAFSGEGRPSWTAQYEDEPTQQGSGHPVNLSGDTVLVLRMGNTAYPVDTSHPEGYEGTSPLYTDTVLEEIRFDGIYEGYTEVFVGMLGEHPFRVRWDEATSSVILEVRHD